MTPEHLKWLDEILKCNCGGNNYLNGSHYYDCAISMKPAIQQLLTEAWEQGAKEARSWRIRDVRVEQDYSVSMGMDVVAVRYTDGTENKLAVARGQRESTVVDLINNKLDAALTSKGDRTDEYTNHLK